MNSYVQLSRDIQNLRLEKIRLQKDEEILRKLIEKIKTQVNAVQVTLTIFIDFARNNEV